MLPPASTRLAFGFALAFEFAIQFTNLAIYQILQDPFASSVPPRFQGVVFDVVVGVAFDFLTTKY